MLPNAFRALLLAAAMVLLPRLAAHASEVSFPSPLDPVPDADKTSYLDLIRKIVPDIAERDGVYRGTEVVALRHLAGADHDVIPPATPSFFDFSALPLADGHRLLLLLDLGQAEDSAEGFAVLALYDLSGAPRLVDAANVAFDRATWFYAPVRLALGEGREAVLTMSMHFNSSQTYVTNAVVLVGERLELVGSVSTFYDRTCALQRSQEASFSTGGGTPADIVVAVVERTEPTGEDCDGETPGPPSQRTIAGRYVWDAQDRRYRPEVEELDRLASENEERF